MPTIALSGECEIYSRDGTPSKIGIVTFNIDEGILCAFGDCRSAEYFSDNEGAVLAVTAIPSGRMTVYYIPERSSRSKMDGWSQYTGNYSANPLRNCRFSGADLVTLSTKRTANYREPL